MTTGRNELCPCGSGKKYKHCCLGRAEPATTEAGRLGHVRNATERLVFDRILRWAERRFGRDWLEQPLESLGEFIAVDRDELQFLIPWIVYCLPLQAPRRKAPRALGDRGTPAACFLAERGDDLTPVERETLSAYTRTYISLWEVRRVEPGVGLELFDLLTHETRFVHEVRGSRGMRPWNVLLASVVDHPEVSVFGGLYPRVLMPVEAERVLGIVRRMLGVRKRVLKPVNLSGTAVQLAMVLAWREATFEAEEAASKPRIVNNTDGDPLVFCADRFDILGPVKELVASLATIEGADVDEEGGEIVFTRPENKMSKQWQNTIIGRAVVNGDRLLVETNSVARADALRKRIEKAAGTRLRYRLREVRDVEHLMDDPSFASMPAPEPPPEARAAMREVLERMRDAWVDERIPALSGRTPRQAATSPTLKPRLVALLKQFEMHEAARPEEDRYDVGRLWRALGIEP